MGDIYNRAKRTGEREVHRAVAEGRYPYPVALDDILKDEQAGAEFPVGLVEIPVSMIAGTKTAGRQNAFSCGFMPILPGDSEFALKWEHLYDSQLEEGIRDPIKVYEYMQRFYVQEGNKRVSVTKFVDMPLIMANVYRILPRKTDDPAVRVYYEFLDFYSVAPIYEITISEEGGFLRLAELLGQNLQDPWPDDVVETVRSCYSVFGRIYDSMGGKGQKLQTGDAFLLYLTIYSIDSLLNETENVIRKRIERIWGEIQVEVRKDISLVENPEEVEEKHTGGLLTVLKRTPLYTEKNPLRVAFIYDKAPEESSWIYGHELGRIALENAFPGVVETARFDNGSSDEEIERAVEAAAADLDELVITTSPAMMTQTLREAIRYPDMKFMNCSVNLAHSAVRTYYGRLYEAKFVMGALAASVCENHKIGYRADYPIYGSIANINAFAIGAALVDPKAKLYLSWASRKDEDWRGWFRNEDIYVFSGPELIRPQKASREYGIYIEDHEGNVTNLAVPMWNWGRYYEQIVGTILNGSWDAKAIARKDQALNYWWGMSAGVIDVLMSRKLSYYSKKLVETLKAGMIDGRLNPFDGELHSQTGIVKEADSPRLSNEEIIRMDWLNDNVVGAIPVMEELKEKAKETVQVSGVPEAKAKTAQ